MVIVIALRTFSISIPVGSAVVIVSSESSTSTSTPPSSSERSRAWGVVPVAKRFTFIATKYSNRTVNTIAVGMQTLHTEMLELPPHLTVINSLIRVAQGHEQCPLQLLHEHPVMMSEINRGKILLA